MIRFLSKLYCKGKRLRRFSSDFTLCSGLGQKSIEITQALADATHRLEAQNSTTSPQLDAEVLLAFTFKKNRTYLYTYPDMKLTLSQQTEFEALIRQRIKGKPIAYLTGLREFWSLPLQVSTNTLIPRPETELLVELALSLIDKTTAKILDLGTGSGAIALALASERPNWQIIATDVSKEALEVAQNNALMLNIENISFYHSCWFEHDALNTLFDAIITNPPYISPNDVHLSQGDLRFEPQRALVSDENGMAAIKHIIQNSHSRIKPSGLLLIEHGYNQKNIIESLLNQHQYQEIQCWQDYNGNDRVSGGRVIENLNI